MNAGVILDDCIMQKGLPAAAGSKMLENFIAPFDAHVVTRLNESGVSIAGRAKAAEFGMCPPPELAAGTLCSDVFGHYRLLAAQNGLFCIRPTYGTVSRFGLIPAAVSMDQIGVVCEDVEEGFTLLSLIAGHDPRDGAMFPDKAYAYDKPEKKPVIADLTGDARKLKYSEVFDQVMYILSCAEAANNISRYDGVKFGYRAPDYTGLNDMYLKTRAQAFGIETKLAAIMGAAVLSSENYVRYYEKAMKIRRLIKQSLPFGEYDVLALPAESPLAPLAGLASLAFSRGGQSVQLVADAKNDAALISAWEVFAS